jgi:hypothetical protein
VLGDDYAEGVLEDELGGQLVLFPFPRGISAGSRHSARH